MIEAALEYAANCNTKLLSSHADAPSLRKIERLIKPASFSIANPGTPNPSPCIAFILTAGTTPITWSSKKQTCVAFSSTKSKYRALVEINKEAIWMQELYTELGFNIPMPFKIYCNNQSAIKISKNPIYYSKTKHFVRDMTKKQKIEVLYIPIDK